MVSNWQKKRTQKWLVYILEEDKHGAFVSFNRDKSFIDGRESTRVVCKNP